MQSRNSMVRIKVASPFLSATLLSEHQWQIHYFPIREESNRDSGCILSRDRNCGKLVKTNSIQEDAMENWHVLITGGGTGIGFAIAARLIERGAFVHLTGRRGDVLEKAQASLGKERCFIYPGDIGKGEDRATLERALYDNTGGNLDALVINAGIYGMQPLLEITPHELEQYFMVNALGSVMLAQACHPMLIGGQGKSILVISSTLGERPVPGVAAYAASKAALNSFAKSIALEWAKEGIRCNVIQPGVVNTPIHDPKAEGEPEREAKMNELARLHPLGRVGSPNDVAEAALYLLSDRANWVTGASINVDGGILLA
jgi:NAD(P)-dependent dehydrogenase (short-subunit alcohol dehydrogenase family)